jgi:hypothetical protein
MSHFSKIGNCAILVFAKSAVCENESKRILDSSINNMMLWSTLNNNVLKNNTKSKILFRCQWICSDGVNIWTKDK